MLRRYTRRQRARVEAARASIVASKARIAAAKASIVASKFRTMAAKAQAEEYLQRAVKTEAEAETAALRSAIAAVVLRNDKRKRGDDDEMAELGEDEMEEEEGEKTGWVRFRGKEEEESRADVPPKKEVRPSGTQAMYVMIL